MINNNTRNRFQSMSKIVFTFFPNIVKMILGWDVLREQHRNMCII